MHLFCSWVRGVFSVRRRLIHFCRGTLLSTFALIGAETDTPQASLMRQAGFSEDTQDKVTGHKAHGSVGTVVYGHWTLQEIQAVVEAIQYPDLRLLKVTPCAPGHARCIFRRNPPLSQIQICRQIQSKADHWFLSKPASRSLD
jgi:hypothetical protein